MPDSKAHFPRRRKYLIGSDDLLFRLTCLPEREQAGVLSDFSAAIEAAESAVIAREALIYDAQHHPQPAAH